MYLTYPIYCNQAKVGGEEICQEKVTHILKLPLSSNPETTTTVFGAYRSNYRYSFLSAPYYTDAARTSLRNMLHLRQLVN